MYIYNIYTPQKTPQKVTTWKFTEKTGLCAVPDLTGFVGWRPMAHIVASAWPLCWYVPWILNFHQSPWCLPGHHWIFRNLTMSWKQQKHQWFKYHMETHHGIGYGYQQLWWEFWHWPLRFIVVHVVRQQWFWRPWICHILFGWFGNYF